MQCRAGMAQQNRPGIRDSLSSVPWPFLAESRRRCWRLEDFVLVGHRVIGNGKGRAQPLGGGQAPRCRSASPSVGTTNSSLASRARVSPGRRHAARAARPSPPAGRSPTAWPRAVVDQLATHRSRSGSLSSNRSPPAGHAPATGRAESMNRARFGRLVKPSVQRHMGQPVLGPAAQRHVFDEPSSRGTHSFSASRMMRMLKGCPRSACPSRRKSFASDATIGPGPSTSCISSARRPDRRSRGAPTGARAARNPARVVEPQHPRHGRVHLDEPTFRRHLEQPLRSRLEDAAIAVFRSAQCRFRPARSSAASASATKSPSDAVNTCSSRGQPHGSPTCSTQSTPTVRPPNRIGASSIDEILSGIRYPSVNPMSAGPPARRPRRLRGPPDRLEVPGNAAAFRTSSAAFILSRSVDISVAGQRCSRLRPGTRCSTAPRRASRQPPR